MITLERIIELCNANFEIDITRRSRERHYIYSRYVYYFLARKFTKASSHTIGFFCGKRDHATTLHGLKRFEEFKDQKFYTDYTKICIELSEYIKENYFNDSEIDISELKTPYEIKAEYERRQWEISKKYEKRLSRLKKANKLNVISKIAELPEKDLLDFEKLAEVFYKNRKQKQN